jgi:hypothetical protein
MTKEEIEKIMKALAEAYEKAGKKLTTATIVSDIKEDGTLEGEVIYDERDKEDLN